MNGPTTIDADLLGQLDEGGPPQGRADDLEGAVPALTATLEGTL